MVFAAVWVGDGCFKDPGATVCVGVAACACYEDGRCTGDLVCDAEQICRRADCRPGEDKCPCSNGLCLGELVCDGSSCRQPGEVDDGNPGDGGPGDGGPGDGNPGDGNPDDDDDDDDDDDVTTGSLDGPGDGMGPTSASETEGPPPTGGQTDEGNVEEGPETSGGPMCEPQDWAEWQCGWEPDSNWWGCGGGGACGAPDGGPILCPDGFAAGTICTEVGVDPLQGCCMPDGNEAFCVGDGPATVIECTDAGGTG